MNRWMPAIGMLLVASALHAALAPITTTTQAKLEQIAANLTHFGTDNLISNRSTERYARRWPDGLAQEQVRLMADLKSLEDEHDALLALLKHPDPKVRTLALGALYIREDPHDLPAIAALIRDTAPTFPLIRDSLNSAGGPLPLSELEQPQTVGEVAYPMIVNYLAASRFGQNKLSTQPRPTKVDLMVLDDFAAYWAARGQREYCAGWLLVKMNRATRQTEPIQSEYLPDIRRVLAEIEKLPSPDREWTRLYVGYGTPLPAPGEVTGLLSEASLIPAAQALGPDALMNFLLDKKISPDPDLLFDAERQNPRAEIYREVSGFILRHARALLRPEDAALILANTYTDLNHWQSTEAQWAAAAAELQPANEPAKALAIIEESMSRHPLRDSSNQHAQAVLAAALWRARGMAQIQFLVDWFYNALELTRGENLPHGPADFLREVRTARRPDTQELLAALVADPRFARADFAVFRELLPMAAEGLSAPLVSTRTLYDYASNQNRPDREEVFASWRALLRRRYGLPENAPPPPALETPTLLTSPIYAFTLKNARDPNGFSTALAATADRVFITPRSGQIIMADAATGTPLWQTASGGPAFVASLVDESASHWLVLDDNGRLFDWDVSTRTAAAPRRFPNDMSQAAFNHDGDRLVLFSQNGLACYDAYTGQMLWKKPGLLAAAGGKPEFAPDGKSLVVCLDEPATAAGVTHHLRLLDSENGDTHWDTVVQDHDLGGAAFSQDGHLIVTATGQIELWDATTGKLYKQYDRYPLNASTRRAEFSPDGKWLAVSFDGGYPRVHRVGILNVESGQVRREIDTGTGVGRLAFSPDGKRLYTLDSQLRAWQLE